MSNSNVFDVTFPLGLIRLELQLLMEDYLVSKVLTEVLEKECVRDLTIHLSTGK